MATSEHPLVTELRALILDDREDVAAMPTTGKLSLAVEAKLRQISEKLDDLSRLPPL